MPSRLLRAVVAVVVASGVVGGLAACGDGSAVGNVVRGTVDGLRGEAERALGDALGDVLGGAGISTDGTLPETFPVADVPLVEGTVRGGGTGPDGSGWAAQVVAADGVTFEAARAQLEAAGFTAGGVDSDATSGFGHFTSAAWRVLLTFSTEASSGEVVATYVVTPL